MLSDKIFRILFGNLEYLRWTDCFAIQANMHNPRSDITINHQLKVFFIPHIFDCLKFVFHFKFENDAILCVAAAKN